MARYEALKDPMVARKQKLADSLRLQQLFRDIEDEETWIREKEPIAASTNRGWSIPVSLGFKCQNCSVINCILIENSLKISELLGVIITLPRVTYLPLPLGLCYVAFIIAVVTKFS